MLSIRWLSVWVYAAALIVAMLVPWPRPIRIGGGWMDELVHFGAWTVLAFLIAVACGRSLPTIGAAALAALAAICFGALVEVLQPLTGRSAGMLDLAADALGSAVGAAAAAVVAWSGERAAGQRAAGQRGAGQGAAGKRGGPRQPT